MENQNHVSTSRLDPMVHLMSSKFIYDKKRIMSRQEIHVEQLTVKAKYEKFPDFGKMPTLPCCSSNLSQNIATDVSPGKQITQICIDV